MNEPETGKFQAALLRISMELRTKACSSLPEATRRVATAMEIDSGQLQQYVHRHFGQLMAATKTERVSKGQYR